MCSQGNFEPRKTLTHFPTSPTQSHTEPESVGNLITQHTAVSFSLTKHFFACLAPSLGVIKWGCNNSSETCTLKKKKKKKGRQRSENQSFA